MNPVLIAAGIYLSAKIISFIAGELTESELQKQKDIEDTLDQLRSDVKNEESSSEKVEDVKTGKAYSDKKSEVYEYLKKEAESRQSEFELFLNDICDSKRSVVDALHAKNVVQTPLRRSSLELLLRQLSEAQKKCQGYIQYLKIYCDEIWKNRTSEDIPVFSMQLSPSYPYVGKVLWVNTDQLSDRTIDYKLPELFDVTISVTDRDDYKLPANSLQPIMITKNSGKFFYASLEKGSFKANELVNTHLGLSALVKEIQRDHILLTYQNSLELYLSRDNLIKPDRFPPIRSSLTVYPVKWEYDLEPFKYNSGKPGYPVTVSERKEDAGSSLAFKCFPICFSEDDLLVFKKFYNENRLQDYDEEFLIGPAGSEDVMLKKGALLKLQFGDIPLFYLEVDEHPDRDDILRFFFRFHKMCDLGEKTFSADDIFLPFDVSFTPYYAGTSDEMIQQYMDIDDLDDVAALIWDLFEEFRIQDQMRKDREGMGYFFKWESLTNRLISALEQGDSIQVGVKWLDADKRNCVFAEVQNIPALDSFIQQFARKTDALIMHEWKPQFFVKDDLGNRYVTTILDSGRRLRIVGKNVAFVFSGQSDVIELFASNRPYAEYQQKAALRRFRIGQVVNPVIQAACLNSRTIVSNENSTCELSPFHNENLSSNQSQKSSVEHAFKEKNIFLIQGPPGTGKTTVIRELVEQVLEYDEDSRILIVSQANVAVDNALTGLVEKYGDQTVRCGIGNKISAEFQRLRLQNRCQDYLDDLERRKTSFDRQFYSNWEDMIVSNESYEYSPVLCELVIRSHRLIGATCVGLAKRNIGLERTEFDLVIIDEAGKALPAEMLIPLVRAKKAVIIGDQRQLPPVINPILYDEEKIDLEERAVSENDLFFHSFFERLYDNAPDSCKRMLDTQFRMPAVIGTAISQLFYDGRLKNGAGTDGRKPVLFNSNLTFINFDGDNNYHEYKNRSKQIINRYEARAAVALVTSIRKKNKDCSIVVITPYKEQKRLISNTLIKSGIHFRLDKIAVDTIDSFQGSEADIVILCSTRAIKPTLFFKDSKRINVALSRAKRELIILGKMSYYYKYSRTESCLPGLADYIKENGNIIISANCDEIRYSSKQQNNTALLLTIESISLPIEFYTEEINENEIQAKIDEYYNNGDFVRPVNVKKTAKGFILKDSYAQFRAAQELNLTECLCYVIA